MCGRYPRLWKSGMTVSCGWFVLFIFLSFYYRSADAPPASLGTWVTPPAFVTIAVAGEVARAPILFGGVKLSVYFEILTEIDRHLGNFIPLF